MKEKLSPLFSFAVSGPLATSSIDSCANVSSNPPIKCSGDFVRPLQGPKNYSHMISAAECENGARPDSNYVAVIQELRSCYTAVNIEMIEGQDPPSTVWPSFNFWVSAPSVADDQSSCAGNREVHYSIIFVHK